MPLSAFWMWLESLPMAAHIGATWWFPLLESIHVVSATFLVGSILMVDLRLLGLAARQHAVSRIIREVVPWTYAACFISIVTGVGLFMTRASHYVENPAFQVKMLLLVLAGFNMAIFHLLTRRSLPAWDTTAATTAPSKLAGACSLLLWAGIMLSGRWVGHLT